jgi:hypothetical protein
VKAFAEHSEDRVSLDLRREMAVTASHVLSSVTDDVVDDALVHAGLGQPRDKRMPKYMKPAHHRPSGAASEHALDMVVAFGRGQRQLQGRIPARADSRKPALQRCRSPLAVLVAGRAAALLAPTDLAGLAEQVRDQDHLGTLPDWQQFGNSIGNTSPMRLQCDEMKVAT